MISWSDIIDWFVFDGNINLMRNIPPMESKDGEEPTVEALRERARQIDAQPQVKPTKMLPSKKATDTLDKEFWESQE